jgi:hypothetical protein
MLRLPRGTERTLSARCASALGILAFVVAGGLAAVPPAAVAAATKQTAQDMLTDAKSAIAYIAKGMKTAKVDPAAKANQPFVAALKEVEQSVAAVQRGLAAKSKDYYTALDRLRRSTNTLQITFSRSQITAKPVNDGVKALLASVSALDTHYSREAERRKKGGTLSDAEQAKLSAMQSQQQAFAAKLDQLEKQLAADPKVDKDFKQKLTQMRTRSSALSTAAPTVATLTDVLLLTGELAGWWDGLSYYVPPSYRKDWVIIDDGFVDSWDDTYADTILLVDVPSDWTYLQVPATVEPDYYEVSIPAAEVPTYEQYVTEITVVVPSSDDDRVGYAEDVDASIEDIDAREAATGADEYDLDSELDAEDDEAAEGGRDDGDEIAADGDDDHEDVADDGDDDQEAVTDGGDDDQEQVAADDESADSASDEGDDGDDAKDEGGDEP